jgi:hypothetical protein
MTTTIRPLRLLLAAVQAKQIAALGFNFTAELRHRVAEVFLGEEVPHCEHLVGLQPKIENNAKPSHRL